MDKEKSLTLFKASFYSSVVFIIIMTGAFGYTVHQIQKTAETSLTSQLKEVRDELNKVLSETSSADIAVNLKALNADILSKLEQYKGAVIPFQLNSCPSGWEEFKPAYGRFIRGIDKSGKGVDPDGLRTPGNLQNHVISKHSHSTKVVTNGWPKDSGDRTRTGSANYIVHFSQQGNKGALESTVNGGSESRPKNVALLYCKKT